MRITIILIFLFNTLFATSITEDPSFKKIYKQQSNSNKVTLMIYSTSSCPQCAYMKQKVFKDKDVKRILDRYFVILNKDIQVDDLPDGFDYFGIPTIFFINENGEKLGKFIGSCRVNEFIKELNAVVKKAHK